MKEELLKLADATDETAREIVAWAAKEQGPWSDEIYRTNCQIAGAFHKLADQMRALAKEK